MMGTANKLCPNCGGVHELPCCNQTTDAELKRLRAEVTSLKELVSKQNEDVQDWMFRCSELSKQLAAAKEQNALLTRDAERYRWLRKQHWNEAALCVVAEPKDAVKLGHYCPSLESLDAFIDSAIPAQKAI